MGILEGAAKDRSFGIAGLSAGHAGDDCTASIIVARMSARSGNSPAEEQIPSRVVQNRLARGEGVKSIRLQASLIGCDRNPWYRGGAIPKICPLPPLLAAEPLDH